MNLSFFTAVTGAQQQQQRMGVTANNIANVNTYGFKAERPAFATLLSSRLDSINEPFPRGGGGQMITAPTDFNTGALVSTYRTQDYAIQGSGFFALYNPADGEISYTRDGSFTLSEFQRPDMAGEMETVWMLSDGNGRFVLSDSGTLVEVQDPSLPQPVGVFDFVNTNGMRHVGGNRFVPVDKNGQVRLGSGEVCSGMLEASNADLANELSKVIESQRSYSLALKMVQTSDEIESTVNGLRS